jgi:hypothetical protein
LVYGYDGGVGDYGEVGGEDLAEVVAEDEGGFGDGPWRWCECCCMYGMSGDGKGKLLYLHMLK